MWTEQRTREVSRLHAPFSPQISSCPQQLHRPLPSWTRLFPCWPLRQHLSSQRLPWCMCAGQTVISPVRSEETRSLAGHSYHRRLLFYRAGGWKLLLEPGSGCCLLLVSLTVSRCQTNDNGLYLLYLPVLFPIPAVTLQLVHKIFHPDTALNAVITRLLFLSK